MYKFSQGGYEMGGHSSSGPRLGLRMGQVEHPQDWLQRVKKEHLDFDPKLGRWVRTDRWKRKDKKGNVLHGLLEIADGILCDPLRL